MRVFLATLGQRPEAITIALDRLCEEYQYESIGVLHTDPRTSTIAEALNELQGVMKRDYRTLAVHYHELKRVNTTPLVDVADSQSAADYHRAVLSVLYSYKEQGNNIHLLVAGGRKAMSIYAMLAAEAVFNPPHDKVWTVLSSEALIMQRGQFHIPPGMREQVVLVDLPLITQRLAPGINPLDQPARQSRREAFWMKLTPQEQRLAAMFERHPHASNADLGRLLHKSPRTIENQFASLYNKLIGFLEYGELLGERKRIALLEILHDEASDTP